MKTRREIHEAHYKKYQSGSKKEKGKILDDLEGTTGQNRDYLAHVLTNYGKTVYATIEGKPVTIIEVIAANSAQAKGRVERNHGVDQDRLVKELRLAGISTIEEANIFLLDRYLPKMNKKFGCPAVSHEDAHVNPLDIDLDSILCMEHERKVSRDYIIRFETRLFQILPEAVVKPRPGDIVIVRVKMDYSVSIIWKNKPIATKEIKLIFDEYE